MASTLHSRTRPRIARSGPWSIRIGSLLIPLAHAAGQNVVTVLGLRFMTDSLAISAGTAGLIFALVKIYDGFLDPTVGAWSDRFQSRWGRRLPFLFAGGLAMPLGVVMLFGAPDVGSILLTEIFVTLALVIHASGYTLMTIPGFAMVVESSTDPDERARLMAWRTYGNAIGALLGSTLPTWLLGMIGPGRQSHLILAALVGAIVFGATLAAVRLLRDAPRTAPRADIAERRGHVNLWQQLTSIWANRPFQVLAIAHVFLLFGTVIGSATLAYFTRVVLKVGDAMLGTYFMLSTVAMVIAMPVWVFAARHIGRKACYMIALAVYGINHMSWLLAGAGEGIFGVSARALVGGFAGGGMILCAYALLSDAVRYDFVRSGERREGAFAGITTLLDKLSSAAALAALGAFLSAMGYVSSAGGAAQTQGARAEWAIMMCESVIPALAMAGAFITMFFYRLDADALIAEEMPALDPAPDPTGEPT
jgi:GPH family glycoside/pentoside/hexuronide:cation symporter